MRFVDFISFFKDVGNWAGLPHIERYKYLHKFSTDWFH